MLDSHLWVSPCRYLVRVGAFTTYSWPVGWLPPGLLASPYGDSPVVHSNGCCSVLRVEVSTKRWKTPAAPDWSRYTGARAPRALISPFRRTGGVFKKLSARVHVHEGIMIAIGDESVLNERTGGILNAD